MIKTYVAWDQHGENTWFNTVTKERALENLNGWCKANNVTDEQIINIETGWAPAAIMPQGSGVFDAWVRILYKSSV